MLKFGAFILIFGTLHEANCEKLSVFDRSSPSTFLENRDDYSCMQVVCSQWPINETCYEDEEASSITGDRGEQAICIAGMSIDGGYEFDYRQDNDASAVSFGETEDDYGYLGQNDELYAIVHMCMASQSPCNTAEESLKRIRAKVTPYFFTTRIEGWCFYGADETDIRKNGLDYQKMMDCWMNDTWDMNTYDDYSNDINIFFYDEITGFIGGSSDGDYVHEWATHKMLWFCDIAETDDTVHVMMWANSRDNGRDFDYEKWPFPHPRYEMDGDECWRAMKDPYFGIKGSKYIISLSLIAAVLNAVLQIII